MRVDWVTGNIYFMVDHPGNIFVCNVTAIPRCKSIGSNPNKYPYVSLAVDSSAG